jgi:hypothetical protein
LNDFWNRKAFIAGKEFFSSVVYGVRGPFNHQILSCKDNFYIGRASRCVKGQYRGKALVDLADDA